MPFINTEKTALLIISSISYHGRIVHQHWSFFTSRLRLNSWLLTVLCHEMNPFCIAKLPSETRIVEWRIQGHHTTRRGYAPNSEHRRAALWQSPGSATRLRVLELTESRYLFHRDSQTSWHRNLIRFVLLRYSLVSKVIQIASGRLKW